MRTVALAHIPSKGNLNPTQATVDPVFQPDALGISSPTTGVEEDSGSQVTGDESPPDAATTDADCFGVYRVYARKPINDPIQCTSRDAHSLVLGESRSEGQVGTAANQGPPRPDMQATPYYHPFSNPSAAAMMVAHHIGTHMQSVQKTTEHAHILASLGSDLNPLDLGCFDAALENKKLDKYLTSAPESMFQREDGWLESSV